MGAFITGSYADRHKPSLLIAVSRVLRLSVGFRRSQNGQNRSVATVWFKAIQCIGPNTEQSGPNRMDRNAAATDANAKAAKHCKAPGVEPRRYRLGIAP